MISEELGVMQSLVKFARLLDAPLPWRNPRPNQSRTRRNQQLNQLLLLTLELQRPPLENQLSSLEQLQNPPQKRQRVSPLLREVVALLIPLLWLFVTTALQRLDLLLPLSAWVQR